MIKININQKERKKQVFNTGVMFWAMKIKVRSEVYGV